MTLLLTLFFGSVNAELEGQGSPRRIDRTLPSCYQQPEPLTGLLVAKKDRPPADYPATRQLPPDAALLRMIETQASPPEPPRRGADHAVDPTAKLGKSVSRRIKPRQLLLPFTDRDDQGTGQRR